ncbi:MAG TPA: XRE family transcriptional regulator [Bacteroidia bacterium]
MGKQQHNIPEDFLRKAGERIRELRIKAGYNSYETFALDHNLDRKQYWRMENGSNTTLRSLYKVMKLHKKSPKEFFSKGFDEL